MSSPTLIIFAIVLAIHYVARASVGWSLVWSDEFSGQGGSAPDAAKWTFDLGTGRAGWGNNELQTYTSRAENVRIEDGRLVIEARKENLGGSSYTSARIKTQGLAAWTYGRIEARIKVPRGQGIWPAFWMLGTDINSVGWPKCGEIDIMENIGKETNRVHGTIHGPGYAGGQALSGNHTWTDANIADAFRVFAVEWQTNQIKWFVDGIHYFTATPTNLPPGAKWVFDRPQFIILNVAVGGNWPGKPDEKTVFPQRMEVDHVRVYAMTNLPGIDADGVRYLKKP